MNFAGAFCSDAECGLDGSLAAVTAFGAVDVIGFASGSTGMAGSGSITGSDDDNDLGTSLSAAPTSDTEAFGSGREYVVDFKDATGSKDDNDLEGSAPVTGADCFDPN